jgi:hypothetical protein
MARLVSDEVWRQLDPNVGRLSRRTSRRLLLSGVVGLVVVLAAAVGWRSGAVSPRLVWSQDSAYAFSFGPGGPVTASVNVTNSGWVPLTLVGVGRSGPGLELARVEGILPITLGPGDATTFILTYRITDCAAVPHDPWPVPVRVKRWWGEQTAYIPLPTEPADDGLAEYSYSGDDDPYALQWQRYLADGAC